MKKHLILIIDTAHLIARVIIADDKNTLGMKEWPNTPKVGTDLLIHIDELIGSLGKKKDDITRIAVHSGPGSYGLVRTGIVTATILAQAIGAQLVEAQGESIEELVESARSGKVIASIEAKYRE